MASDPKLKPGALSKEVLSQLGYLILDYEGRGYFTVVGSPPRWLHGFPEIAEQTRVHLLDLTNAFAFLETSLTSLERLWINTTDQEKDLGEWAETDTSGGEFHLKASLLSVRNARLLLLRMLDKETVRVIRKAREIQLQQQLSAGDETGREGDA